MPRRQLVLLTLLVAMLVPASASAHPWHPDIRAARRYARHRAGEVGFAVIDQRGRFGGYDVRDTAPAASVFKVMLLARCCVSATTIRCGAATGGCWRR